MDDLQREATHGEHTVEAEAAALCGIVGYHTPPLADCNFGGAENAVVEKAGVEKSGAIFSK